MPRTSVRHLLLTPTALFLFLVLLAPPAPAQAKWKYLRTGNSADSTVTPRTGFALMGGGSHQDAAFKFLCERANGGDFLVLSANDEDDYLKREDERLRAICPLNSEATLSFFSRKDSEDPAVVKIIEQAESIFIAGGDQSDYVRYWQDTPVQDALNRHIAAGKPIGGSSAGLAILGQFSFSSMIDTIYSPEALANPYGNKVTLTRDFLRIPLLADTITDTHFVKRDRLGRLLVFMARILQDGWAKQVRAIAVDENAALLVEPDGASSVVGEGAIYFLQANHPPQLCAYQQPLTFTGIAVQRVQPGKTFQLKKWSGESDTYSLSVVGGVVRSIGTSGIYGKTSSATFGECPAASNRLLCSASLLAAD
ncbi:MAG: cyanophycinase [Candidatus Acidiferrum sp.]